MFIIHFIKINIKNNTYYSMIKHLKVNGDIYKVRYVSHKRNMSIGLSEHTHIQKNFGMLFDFKKVLKNAVFNMYEMSFCIDIVVIG